MRLHNQLPKMVQKMRGGNGIWKSQIKIKNRGRNRNRNTNRNWN